MKKNDNKIALGYVAIMFAMLFWGLSFVWIKHLLNNNFPVCGVHDIAQMPEEIAED